MMAIIWMAVVAISMLGVTIKTWKTTQNRGYKIFSVTATAAMILWTIFNLVVYLCKIEG